MNTTTLEQADALIEKIGMTEMVEDYEHNELGHVYTLKDNSTLTVTSPETFQVHKAE